MAENNPMLAIGDMPPEYIAQITENMRRRAMADAMLQQFTQGQQTQFVPGGTGVPIAVKQGGVSALAQALSGLSAGQQSRGFAAENEALRLQNDAERQKEYQDFVTNPDKAAAIAKAMASRRPGVQAFALEQQKREQDRIKAFSQAISPTDAQRAGQLFDPNYKMPEVKAPTFGSTPSGANYAIIPGPNNKQELKFEPKGVNVSVNGDKFEPAAEKALGGKVPDMAEKYQTQAVTSLEGIDKANRLYTLANDPEIIAGAGATPQLFLTSVGAKLGFTGPEAVTKTQELLSAIASQTLAASKELKGAISDKEGPFLRQASAGELTYTPEALKHLASLAAAVNHNGYLNAVRGWNSTTSLRGAEAAAGMYPLPDAKYTLPGAEGNYEQLPGGRLRYNGSYAPIPSKKTPKEKVYTVDELQQLLKQQNGGR